MYKLILYILVCSSCERVALSVVSPDPIIDRIKDSLILNLAGVVLGVPSICSVLSRTSLLCT